MSDVFSEVEEEVRRERWSSWARRYGPIALALVALIIAGVGGWQLYRGWSTNEAREMSEEFVAAQEMRRAGKAEASVSTFAGLSERGPLIYRQMAQMERAAALADSGDLQAALAAFDALAAEARNPVVRDTARLRAAYLAAETQDYDSVAARVAPLTAEGGPISFLARELEGIEAWEAGQFDSARETFESLSLAFEAPESVRQRAQIALSVIGPGAREEAIPAPAPAAAEKQEAPAAPTGESK